MARRSDRVARWPGGPVAPWPSEHRRDTRTVLRPLRHFATPPLGHSAGQSILEYVILITVLLLAVLAMRERISTAVNNLYGASADRVNQAAADLRAVP